MVHKYFMSSRVLRKRKQNKIMRRKDDYFTEETWRCISINNYASFENMLILKNMLSFYWKGNRMKSEIISKVVKKDSAIK